MKILELDFYIYAIVKVKKVVVLFSIFENLNVLKNPVMKRLFDDFQK